MFILSQISRGGASQNSRWNSLPCSGWKLCAGMVLELVLVLVLVVRKTDAN
jgi:hypothetical protein